MNLRTNINRVTLFHDLYRLISEQKQSIVEITWEQHKFHEKRRWSTSEIIKSIDLKNLSDKDKAHIWNAGRAELTTKPGADRLATLADQESRRWQDSNSCLAAIIQICGTWSRYWNEEESFHEVTLNKLSNLIGLNSIDNKTVIEFRKIFPDDNILRTLFLLAISEIIAAVNYSYCSKVTQDIGLKNLFQKIAADETQHMTYFLSFAKALIDSKEYSPKEVFAVAHLFIREDGELYGSRRQKIEHRNSHINWWDSIDTNIDELPENLERKRKRICLALKQITGIEVNSAVEVEYKWMELVGC